MAKIDNCENIVKMNIRKAMKIRNCSVTKLAEKSGISYCYLSQVLGGSFKINNSLKRIAEALGIETWQLFVPQEEQMGVFTFMTKEELSDLEFLSKHVQKQIDEVAEKRVNKMIESIYSYRADILPERVARAIGVLVSGKGDKQSIDKAMMILYDELDAKAFTGGYEND